MKLISFAIPSYNSQDYLHKCVDSILLGGEEVEIIIVNDGSTDDTSKIAHGYAEKYPDIVKVIDKPNGGHGSGVNAGLKAATGIYYKVVDSDDWLDEDALKKLLAVIKRHISEGVSPDLYVTNFVYEKVYINKRYVSSYEKKFPVERICTWEEVKAFHFSHMLLMHALTFKREKLLESQTVLPERTFYVDNYFMYKPLPYTKTIYYLNVDLYRYFIGRPDQSVTIKNMVNRYDQQLRVMYCLIDAYKWDEIKSMPKGLKKYLWHSLNAIMMNTLMFACAADSPERRKAIKDMWQHIKERDVKLYRKYRWCSFSTFVNWMPWKMRGKIMVWGYNVLCKIVKLG